MALSPVQIIEPPDCEACWALLERIAASSHLKRAARLQELLFYIGKRSLKDGSETVHEQEIGVYVFRRPGGYDTSADNIVRTNVSDLRKRLEAYFDSEGSDEILIVEIPRGSYIPVFKNRPPEPRIAADIQPPAAVSIPTLPEMAHELPRASRNQPWISAVLVAAGVVIVTLAVVCGYFWKQYEALNRSLYTWKYDPSVAEFWNNILDANYDTDVVLADASFGLLQDISKESFPFDDYLNRSYFSQLQSQNLSPEMHTVVARIVRWNVGSQDEFKFAHRILSLDPLGKRIHLYNARDYMPDLSQRDNVILVGGRISNPWDDLFEGRMNFTARFDNNGSIVVVNRAPVSGEQPTYTQMNSLQYCVIGYFPNLHHNGIVLLIEGTGAEATEAAGDFLLSDNQLSSFKKTLHVDKLPYFEALLKVSYVQGTPLNSTVEAYRTYPNLH